MPLIQYNPFSERDRVNCHRNLKAGNGIFPSDFFRRNVVLSFQEDAIGIRVPHPSLRSLRGRVRWGGSIT
jgi:hypothetical protein